jgi:general secretion pathway protein C
LNLHLDSLRAVRPRTLLTAAEVVLTAALAVQGARLAWAVVTPQGPFGEAPRVQAPARPVADLSILASFDPFFRVASATSVSPAPSQGGIVLYGVRAGGARPAAILAAGGGPQKSVGVGEEVEPGLVLAEVRPDHVILRSGAARRRVSFPTPQPGAAVLPAAPTLATPAAEAGPGPAVDPRRLLAQSTLTPRMKGGQPAGYTIFPRGGSDALRQAGFQTGDVLLSVDGVALTPERVSELPQSLAASSAAEIRFERGGQILTTRIQMAQP